MEKECFGTRDGKRKEKDVRRRGSREAVKLI